MAIEALLEEGPLRLDRYMAKAVNHYYATRDPLGVNGDFTTAPEISQLFGELLGVWCATMHVAAGQPECHLVELGPGRGTLMADALRATRKVPGFHDKLTVHLVEASPTLRAKQEATLADAGVPVRWHADIAGLPQGYTLTLANEFLDALPIRQFVRADEGWHERHVTLAGGQLAYEDTPCPGFPLLPDTATVGDIAEVCEEAQMLAAILAERIQRDGGAALFIDYGYAQGHGDTLQALKSHAFHDPLETPGEADLTAHVDFATLARVARGEGAGVFGPLAQGTFLDRLGIRLRLAQLLQKATPAQAEALTGGVERLISPTQMGELFKVMAIVPPGLKEAAGF